MTQVPDQVPDLPAPAGALAPVPAALAAPPPLIAGEQQSAYDELVARVNASLKPADVLEHVFIRDVVDLAWEVLRLRRLKASLMATAAQAGVARLLEPLLDEPERAARDFAARRPGSAEQVEAALAQAGFGADHVAAASLRACLFDFERLERMTAAAEARRNAALYQLELHRASLAMRLRRRLAELEDFELRLLAPAASTRGAPG
jgi:hypothetical protein